MNDTFDFAFAPGAVGFVVKESDAEVGADDVGVFANEWGTVVDVEFVGEASALNGFFEGVMEGFGAFSEVVGGIGEEACVVVDDDAEVGGEVFAVGLDELGAGAEVGHPEVVGVWGFEGFLRACAFVEGVFSRCESDSSEKAIDGGEGWEVMALVLLEPTLVGNFDGDVWVGFALGDDPFLLLEGESVALTEVLTRALGECGEAVFLIGVPPVFKGACGIATPVIVGPGFVGGSLKGVCEGETFFEASGEVRDGAVADECALFLWGDGWVVWHAGRCIPTVAFDKV